MQKVKSFIARVKNLFTQPNIYPPLEARKSPEPEAPPPVQNPVPTSSPVHTGQSIESLAHPDAK